MKSGIRDPRREEPATFLAFMIAFLAAYVATGVFDSAYDAVAIADEIQRHQAERDLFTAYEIGLVIGLASLWAFRVRALGCGASAGFLAAFASGGAHVVPHVASWMPAFAIVGAISGIALFVARLGRPAACLAFAVAVALAAAQALFMALNL